MAIERKRIIIKIAVNICSFFVAATFIFSGFTKAVDPVGGGIKIGEYLNAFGFDLLAEENLLELFAFIQSVLEFMIGLYLLLGMRRKLASKVLLVVMIFMTTFTLYLAKTDIVTNCGCFGDAVNLSNWNTFYKNVVILGAAIVIALYPTEIYKTLRLKNEWFAKVYSFAFVCGLNLYSLYYLPLIDFRPYYIGQNIIEGMDIPADAEPPIYETVFTLRKNGIEKQFTLEDYPDSTWEFVDSKTKLVKKGYEPVIANFTLYEFTTGNEVTDNVLRGNGCSFWLIIPYIEKTDNGVIDAIEDIYDYCQLYGYKLYGFTSSGEEAVQEWKHSAGIDFPFYQADDILLKTMIRSNPGLMLVHKGSIINKWSKNNMPDDEVLTAPLEKLTSIYGTAEKGLKGVFKYLGFFVIPLLFLIFADKYRQSRKRHKVNDSNRKKVE